MELGCLLDKLNSEKKKNTNVDRKRKNRRKQLLEKGGVRCHVTAPLYPPHSGKVSTHFPFIFFVFFRFFWLLF